MGDYLKFCDSDKLFVVVFAAWKRSLDSYVSILSAALCSFSGIGVMEQRNLLSTRSQIPFPSTRLGFRNAVTHF